MNSTLLTIQSLPLVVYLLSFLSFLMPGHVSSRDEFLRCTTAGVLPSKPFILHPSKVITNYSLGH